MAYGKSIRVYLADGTPTGLKHAEIVNWTGQAISCPRKRIAELREWEESKSPGVYFLLGLEETSANPFVYIGESENVLDRLLNHSVKKDFWREAVFFTNKDENLTKSHIKYLESRLVRIASEVGRCVLENGNIPTQSSLPRSDRDSMEEFIGNIKVLMGVLGHRFLEPVYTRVSESKTVDSSSGERVDTSIPLTLNYKKLNANAMLTDEGVVVLKGSEALTDMGEGKLAPGYLRIKQQLVDSGGLVTKGDRLELTVDYLFNSPSAASAILLGRPDNGRVSWRSESGKTLAEIEESGL
ncbi:hypothetical protein GCM10008090_12980 [Arenicella chitinivorans]|uniref:DUF4357 domain-containing protein n=1 Tax=Arenicella chitinivorans TaxID=1329800 RepID=A0A918RQG7_9GAMM|nr:GIY-YIG nuclease family protein [Arenicella chitinivorans]GHA04889.1 hypothetical protein GCM10008090_12980 [Arenicella chitinivorans]